MQAIGTILAVVLSGSCSNLGTVLAKAVAAESKRWTVDMDNGHGQWTWTVDNGHEKWTKKVDNNLIFDCCEGEPV